jgi:signal transduction histidine kinase
VKLLARTNLYYILFSIVTYFIVAGSFYVVVEYLIYQEVDQRLIVERRDFEHFIDQHGYWEESCYFVEDKITLKPLSGSLEAASLPMFKDTVLYNRYNNEPVPFREYSFVNMIGDGEYRVSIRKSLIESRYLLEVITVVMLILLSVGLSLLFLFQRRIAQRIWQPFNDTLSKAKSFDVHEGRGLTLPAEQIFEFNELNSSLSRMTDKIASDYRSLKEFTENASHEIQTPLALINTRIEGLIQDKGFTDQQMAWIQDIHEAAIRLSKLNQALLLLAKIENGQFYEKEKIDLGEVVSNKLTEMEEIFQLRALKVSYNKRSPFIVEMHPLLAEVIVTNLLNNAVKHNITQGGTIDIAVDENRLTIANPGELLTVPPESLFGRFKKQQSNSSSLGLGLAIVRKVSVTHHLRVSYRFDQMKHTLTIDHEKVFPEIF